LGRELHLQENTKSTSVWKQSRNFPKALYRSVIQTHGHSAFEEHVQTHAIGEYAPSEKNRSISSPVYIKGRSNYSWYLNSTEPKTPSLIPFAPGYQMQLVGIFTTLHGISGQEEAANYPPLARSL